jgi:hypothetical protein
MVMTMDFDLRQLSTHLGRQDRRLNDDWLEVRLESWGMWKADLLPELNVPCQTSLKVAEEMRPEQLRHLPPKGISRAMWELQNLWKRKTQRSSGKRISRVPAYMPHHRMSDINKVINALHEHDTWLWWVIVMRYHYAWDWRRVEDEFGMPKRTYYDRLKRAKKWIKRGLRG